MVRVSNKGGWKKEKEARAEGVETTGAGLKSEGVRRLKNSMVAKKKKGCRSSREQGNCGAEYHTTGGPEKCLTGNSLRKQKKQLFFILRPVNDRRWFQRKSPLTCRRG